jgi:hypothetical protein
MNAISPTGPSLGAAGAGTFTLVPLCPRRSHNHRTAAELQQSLPESRRFDTITDRIAYLRKPVIAS